MAELKEDITAERDALREENERLRAELAERPAAGVNASAAAGLSGVHQATRPPFLSEGERAELEMRGVANSPFTGERLTAAEEGVETKADPETVVALPGKREGVEGVDYVYPSVAPGVIDPALTGDKK